MGKMSILLKKTLEIKIGENIKSQNKTDKRLLVELLKNDSH
jgi:hypothetical protein